MKIYQFLIFIFILFCLLFVLTGCSRENEQTTNNINTSRTSTNVNIEQSEYRVTNIVQNQNIILQNTSNEKEISSYSTTIKDKSKGRLTNISITCSILNNTIVKNGDTFSFNETIGKPTAERGYQEASVIIDHKTEKGIGGGNCQVSSTLYNSVLNIPSLVVTERHEHGKDVTYVPDGKDAAVSFGSLDLKFRNDLGYDIRIDASTDNQSVTIKLIQVL